MLIFKDSKAALIIGISIIIAAIIAGSFFYLAKQPQKTIKVVGIASEPYVSDIIKFSISLEENTDPDNLKSGHEKLESQRKNLYLLLEKIGINAEDIHKKPIEVFREFEYNNGNRTFVAYRLNQNFYIVSKKIQQIEELAYNPVEFLNNDIYIRNLDLQYFYSGIDRLKKDLVAKATANARERANKMLENTDVKVGKALSLRSGVFQITEPLSTNVSSSGIYNTNSKEKQISVTAHATFEIK